MRAGGWRSRPHGRRAGLLVRRLAVALPTVASGGLVAGCGTTTRVVDDGGLERAIAADLQTQTAERATVRCPEGQEAAAGATFRCGLRQADGSPAAVRVTLLDGDGRFRFELLPGR